MSLEHTPETGSPRSHRSPLPLSLLLTMSLALAACNKSSTSAELTPAAASPAAEVQKLEIPSSVIGAMPESSTRAERKVLIADVTHLAIGNGDPMQTPYMRSFAPDQSHADQWQLQRMVIGFGPDAGMQFVLGKQEADTVFSWEITDPFNTGDIGFSEKSERTSLPATEGDVPMVQFKKYMGVDTETQVMFTAALLRAKEILTAESQQPQMLKK